MAAFPSFLGLSTDCSASTVCPDSTLTFSSVRLGLGVMPLPIDATLSDNIFLVKDFLCFFSSGFSADNFAPSYGFLPTSGESATGAGLEGCSFVALCTISDVDGESSGIGFLKLWIGVMGEFSWVAFWAICLVGAWLSSGVGSRLPKITQTFYWLNSKIMFRVEFTELINEVR